MYRQGFREGPNDAARSQVQAWYSMGEPSSKMLVWYILICPGACSASPHPCMPPPRDHTEIFALQVFCRQRRELQPLWPRGITRTQRVASVEV